MLTNVEIQRDQVKSELVLSRQETEDVKGQLTEKGLEIEQIHERHVVIMKDKVTEHNIEVNELEQRIQKERIEKAEEKSKSMRE